MFIGAAIGGALSALWHARPRNPAVADFGVRPLHGGPRDPVRSLFLARIAFMSSKSVIERFSVYILPVAGQMSSHGCGQIGIGSIWHDVFAPLIRRNIDTAGARIWH